MLLLDSIYVLILTLIDLIKGAVILSVPLFFITLAGFWLKSKILKRYALSWIQATFLITYIITLILILLVYFGFYALALQGYDIGPLPAELELPFIESFLSGFYFILGILLKRVLAALVLALLIMPFAFLASFFNSYFEKKLGKGKRKKPNKYVVLYAALLATSCIAFIVFSWLNFLLPGVIYLVFIF